jgi:sulfate transport system permease protein
MATFKQPSVIPGFGLTFGYTIFTLSTLVLIPLAALVIKTAGLDWDQFVKVLLDPRAVASYRLTFGGALLAATINGVFGFIIAWTLVRYEFPGRRFLDALIDMPFALPTAVSGIALTAVFGQNGPLGQYLEQWGIKVAYTWIGVVLALTLIGMPFVVRSVQPALLEVQRDLEDAAETLGASRFVIFWRIIIPTVLPSLLTGFAMALARGIGEYGSVIFISGNLAFKTEITPFLIVMRLEEYKYAEAAALGFIMLVFSFALMLSINLLQTWGRRRLVKASR